MKKILMQIAGIILIIFGVCVEVYVRFSNPELTETMLFMGFWQFYIVTIISVVFGYLIYAKAGVRHENSY